MRASASGKARIGLAAAALLACAAASADPTLYRWVDKDGHVHYGDQPGDPKAQLVAPKPSGGASSSGGDADAAAAAKQAAVCKGKNDELDRYKSATTITETDALGNSREYTAEQKDQLLARTQKYLDEHCAAPAAPGSN